MSVPTAATPQGPWPKPDDALVIVPYSRKQNTAGLAVLQFARKKDRRGRPLKISRFYIDTLYHRWQFICNTKYPALHLVPSVHFGKEKLGRGCFDFYLCDAPYGSVPVLD